MSGYRRNINIKKLKAEIRNSRNDMSYNLEKIRKKRGNNIPKIELKPQYVDYGLPNDIEKIIDKKKAVQSNVKVVTFLVISGGISWVFSYYAYKNLFMFFFTWFILGLVLNCICESCGYFNYSPKSEIEKKYSGYLDDMEAYEYWKKYRAYEYWMKLDGHGFEKAVAGVFRGIGYEAIVSKRGGDGGIDIILIKGNKRIAVQCKAHKKAVGPSVVRDLYGTMQALGFTEGMLVSRSGYTEGVMDFAREKNISLFTLEKIIELTL